MTRTIRFTKMHGAGNDYIYVDTGLYPISDPVRAAIEWSRCHTGIGSDGLVLIGRSPRADFSMRIFNADGSEAMMCGNATRCIGKYVYDNGLTDRTTVTLDTLSGIKVLRLHVEDGRVATVTVDMGAPADEPVDYDGRGARAMREQPVVAGGQTFTATAVSMGNPHLVIFTDDVESVPLPAVGPMLECHPLFPGRINVEFAEVRADGSIRMRVWERGSGITQACGTGACATFVAACHEKLCNGVASIVMDGGTLKISTDAATGNILMEGPAVKVFDGTIDTAATFE